MMQISAIKYQFCLQEVQKRSWREGPGKAHALLWLRSGVQFRTPTWTLTTVCNLHPDAVIWPLCMCARAHADRQTCTHRNTTHTCNINIASCLVGNDWHPIKTLSVSASLLSNPEHYQTSMPGTHFWLFHGGKKYAATDAFPRVFLIVLTWLILICILSL